MPTDAAALARGAVRHPAAARRILRLALGTALCLLVSQLLNWPMAFVAPVLTLTILALPVPAPRLKGGIVLILGLVLPVTLGLLLVPLLEHARWAGIGLVTLALFYSFRFTAKGGSAALGTFMTIGLTLVVTIGSVNVNILIILINALAVNAFFGVVFVWIAHACLPEQPDHLQGTGEPPREVVLPETSEVNRRAVRSLLIVLPLALIFLFISGSPAYTVVMIKVASMGQQASVGASRSHGRSLIASTFWGGLAAILAWNLLSLWPSLLLYTLLAGLAGLLFGQRIFSGTGLHSDAGRWSYAFLTMMVLLGPAVLDSPFSNTAGDAFTTRLMLFGLIAVYGTLASFVFDAFWPPKRQKGETLSKAVPDG